MSTSPVEFTAEAPCRCGFAGKGAHLCHVYRGTSKACQEESIVKLVPTLASLAGVQDKYSVVVGCYCAEHWLEAFPNTKAVP